MKTKIVIITASEVKNLELAVEFKKILENAHAEVSIINLVELNLPLYSSRAEVSYSGKDLLEKQLPYFENSHGFVFISPEYNGSTPPVFNNFLAWLSRSHKDWRIFLNAKPAALATFSGGGGVHVLMAMRNQLSFIGMNVIGRQILTHSGKALDENRYMLFAKKSLKSVLHAKKYSRIELYARP